MGKPLVVTLVSSRLLWPMDQRYKSIAQGVGQSEILGRIHVAPIKIGNIFYPCLFTVLDSPNMEFLFGLDMLRKHQKKTYHHSFSMKKGCPSKHPAQGPQLVELGFGREAVIQALKLFEGNEINRGLEYLDEHCNPQVIQRDLKTSNIFLDSNFNAKLSDFGLAVSNGAKNKNNIKLSGNLGYVAPEYLLDDKSDVYAFGVVLLELLLGRRPVEKLAPSQCQSIVTWAMPQLTDRSKLPNIMDPVIKDTMDLKHLYQVAAVAMLCVQPEPSYHPLITDVLCSLIPLLPTELGGTLRVSQVTQPAPPAQH
ncbi:hypothetical protein SO802_013949 [Lithocarpus litseifolius]|uniref:Protein kinase domain-containing protein n=1 Tax=Lithocarpus litseifolius TaxID=425828 RepID=A0AAW2D9K2_9ROSI